MPLYGNLENDLRFRRLISDVCKLVELHPYPWEIKPDPEQIFLNAKWRDIISVYAAIYDQYLQFSGKKRWGCKSTFMIDHLPELLNHYPDARFILLVRDARDVAVSAKHSIFNHFHVYFTAQRWKREQAIGINWMGMLSSNQIMLVKYEELIKNPRMVTSEICEFLNEPFEEKILEYHTSKEASKSGSLSISWANTAKPVMSSNREKFLTELSSEEICLIEMIAHRELTALGYKLTTFQSESPKHDELHPPKFSYRCKELLLRLKVEANHLSQDSNSFLRLKKLLFLRYLSFARRFQ
jgi:hypothetical protein